MPPNPARQFTNRSHFYEIRTMEFYPNLPYTSPQAVLLQLIYLEGFLESWQVPMESHTIIKPRWCQSRNFFQESQFSGSLNAKPTCWELWFSLQQVHLSSPSLWRCQLCPEAHHLIWSVGTCGLLEMGSTATTKQFLRAATRMIKQY